MPKKRGQGEGTISKRSDGTWWGRITVGVNKDGKQKQRAFYGKTRAEVQKKMITAQNELNSGTYTEPSKLTVGAWLDTWIMTYKKNAVKDKTYVGYDQAIRLYIKPAIGGVKLSALRPDNIQALYNEMAGNNLSTSTIHQTHVILSAALKQALINGIIGRNPAIAVSVPKTHKKVSRAATRDEQINIMEALEDNEFETAFLLCIYTGIRKGEALSLKWSDIDYERKRISISRTLDRIKNPSGDKPKTIIAIGPPKSEKSIRTIPIENDVITLLKAHRRRQLEHVLKMAGAFKDDGWVFTNTFGKHLEPRYFSKVFEDVRKRVGIPDLTIHSLRHTFSTRALESGVDMKALQELLGHANYSVTADVYAHVLDDVKVDSISKVSATISEIGKEK